MSVSQKDLAVGGFFVAVGLFYGGTAWKNLPLGRSMDMGPGYLPIILSGILVILGTAVVARSVLAGTAAQFGVFPWRAIVMLTISTIVFAAFIRQLGLFLTVFTSLMIASFATPRVKMLTALAASLCMAGFCVVVFSYGIGLPVPVFGSWFRY